MSGYKYYLGIAALGHPLKHEIHADIFEELATAFAGLRQVIRIEEQWDAVIQNYLDLERHLLDVAATNMVVDEFDVQVFADIRIQFGVKLSNLLSICKSYLDHTPRLLNSLQIPDIDSRRFEGLTHVEYDNRRGYRFMQELRRHAQHFGFPVHGAIYDQSRVDMSEKSKFRHAVATYLEMDRLREDAGFKKRVLAEHPDPKVKSSPLVRDYMEGLSAVHDGVRSALQGQVFVWMGSLRSAMTHFRSVSSEPSLIGLSAFEVDHSGECPAKLREVPLLETMLIRLERLQKRNRHLVNLGRRFVTSDVG